MPRRPLPLLLLLLASTLALATSPTAAEPSHETTTEPTAGVEAWSFLIGRWETTAQRFSAAGEVIEENRGSAEFTWALDRQRLQEREATTLGGQPMEVLNLFAVHPESHQWEVVRTDTLHHVFRVRTGSGDGRTLTFLERDPNPESQVIRRWTYEKHASDRVSLTLEFSDDQGESWFVRNRTVYTRR